MSLNDHSHSMSMEKFAATTQIKIVSIRIKYSLKRKSNAKSNWKPIYAKNIQIYSRRFFKVDDGDVSFFVIFIVIHASVLQEKISLIDYQVAVLVLQHHVPPPSYQLALEPIIYNHSSRLVSWPLFWKRFIGDAINLLKKSVLNHFMKWMMC